jgi:hypothetical protein
VSRSNFPQLAITRQGLTLLNDVIPYWDLAQKETSEKLGEKGADALGTVLNQLIQ